MIDHDHDGSSTASSYESGVGCRGVALEASPRDLYAVLVTGSAVPEARELLRDFELAAIIKVRVSHDVFFAGGCESSMVIILARIHNEAIQHDVVLFEWI